MVILIIPFLESIGILLLFPSWNPFGLYDSLFAYVEIRKYPPITVLEFLGILMVSIAPLLQSLGMTRLRVACLESPQGVVGSLACSTQRFQWLGRTKNGGCP